MAEEINDLPGVPKAVGPYSQAKSGCGLVFLSGQIPLDPETGKLVTESFDAQAEQVMKNIKAVLDGIGLHFSDVIKATILVQDMKDYATMNEIYAKWMDGARPARAAYQVAGLPLGAMVEIEMIAELKK